MDYRRWLWWAEWGLVAAVAGLQGVIYLREEETGRSNFLLTAVQDAQLLAAIALVLGAMILSPGTSWLRVGAIACLPGLWLWAEAAAQSKGFIGVVLGSVTLILVGLRVLGLHVASGCSGTSRQSGQFTLLSLLATITAIAAAIGLLEMMRPMLSAGNIDFDQRLTAVSPRIGDQVRLLVMAAVVGLAGVGGIWTTLRPGGVWLRALAMSALIPSTALYLAHLTGKTNDQLISTMGNLSLGLATVTGLCGISVLPLRVMGFRLARSQTGSGEEPVARRQWSAAKNMLAGESR